MASLRFHSLDLFSGLGGNAYAFRDFATPVMYCENDAGAQSVLRSVMSRGHITTAPVHGDVRDIMQSPEYEHAKLQRPLMLTGSWPCQGNSAVGLSLGMDDPRSGLVRELCDVILDARPEVFFVENTPHVATNGQLAYLRKRLGRTYTFVWRCFTASQLGFHHERRRFYAVGRLKTHQLGGVVKADVARLLLPACGPEPSRMQDEHTDVDVQRLHALGNAVVPAVSLYAFLVLLEQPVEKLDGPSSLDLVLDPNAYTRAADVPLSPLVKHEQLASPLFKVRWSTPRAGTVHACHSLNVRTKRDLGTQLRFERGTPDKDRGKQMSVNWVERLMGYPKDYTAVTAAEASSMVGPRKKRPPPSDEVEDYHRSKTPAAQKESRAARALSRRTKDVI